MNKDFFEFIELCLIDGTINEKKKKVILNKGRQLGIGDEECEVILDAFIFRNKITSDILDTNIQVGNNMRLPNKGVKSQTSIASFYENEISEIKETEGLMNQDDIKDYDHFFNPEDIDLEPFEDTNLVGWGYMNSRTNEVIIPPIYFYATNFINETAIVKLNDGFTLIDKDGNEKTTLRFEKIIYIDDDLYKAKINDEYLLLDSDGEVLSEPYTKIYNFKNNVAIAEEDGKFGIINPGGGIKIKFIYDEINIIYYNRNYIAKVKLDGKYGVFNSRTMIIPCEYDKIDIMGDISIMAIKENETYCFDILGKDEIRHLKKSNSIEKLKTKESEDYLDQEDIEDYDILLNPENLDLEPFEDDNLELWGYKEVITGKIVIPPKYYDASEFYRDRAIVDVNDVMDRVVINKNGKIVISGDYFSIEHITDGVFIVCNNETMEAILDKNGNQLTNYFDSIDLRDSGGIIATDCDKSFLLDIDGEVLSNPYTKIYNFRNEMAIVEEEGKFGIINLGGRIIVKLIYEDINIIPYNGNYIARLKLNGKYGAFNGKKMIIPCEYDKIDLIGDDSIISIKGNETYYFDRLGNDTTLTDLSFKKELRGNQVKDKKKDSDFTYVFIFIVIIFIFLLIMFKKNGA